MKNQLKTIALLGALSALIIGIGALIAPSHLYLFGALALIMNFGAYFFSDRIVLRLHRAREVSRDEQPELHAIVAELAQRAELPMPRVCVMDDPQPNAFATGRNPARGVVVVTQGIMRLLDARELRGVLAHELAHIKNRDILVASIAAAAAALISYVASALSWGALFGMGGQRDEEDSGASGFMVVLVAPIAATLIQLGISRSREYLADETGARISGDPEALASALIKLEQASGLVAPTAATPATASLFIVNPFAAAERMAAWFSTHPRTEERVDRLRELARTGAPAWLPSGRVNLHAGR